MAPVQGVQLLVAFAENCDEEPHHSKWRRKTMSASRLTARNSAKVELVRAGAMVPATEIAEFFNRHWVYQRG